MWPNVWQFAAREEEIQEPESFVVYENAGRSYLVVRQADGSVRAFHNVCLHRGRKLRSEGGRTNMFRCPFHGFAWNTDGSIRDIPCRWDFGHLEDGKMSLPEAEVGRWGGYIFVRDNPGGPSLEEFLAPLPEHFKRWRHEDCYTAAWVGKTIKANWKATAEAFMEAWHALITHPQITPYTGDANTKYFIWGDNVNLALTPFGVPSPYLGKKDIDEQWIMDNFLKLSGRVTAGLGDVKVPAGSTTRKEIGNANRDRLGKAANRDLSKVSDAEVQDAYTYNVFPNFAPWGGFMSNVVYRWRPWPDQDHTLMEVRLLARVPTGEKTPPAVPMQILPDDVPWGASPLGSLGSVLDQDWANLPFVQEGMKASKTRALQLADYQEIRIRQFHQTLDKYLAR
jgi:nitrite reductase/ring-hydroxylating ferredoxin subunit